MAICDFPIDAVYLWVDGADPEWQKRDLQAIKAWSTNNPSTISDESISTARYRDNGELRYSLRSLELYAPWINKVHIVVDKQKPTWLDCSKVNLVDQRDILPSGVACPVFNSNLIELCMHRIPGLSNHFLSFNDDFMLGAPTCPSDFFCSNGKPKIWLAPKINKSSPLVQKNSTRKIAENLTRKIILEKFGIYYPHKIKHYPRSYVCSAMQEMWSFFPAEVNRSLQARFRNEDNIITYLFYPYFLLASEKGISRKVSGLPQVLDFFRGRICHVGASLGDKNYKTKMRRIKFLKPLTFCINDSENATEADIIYLQNFLNTLFPKKSKFEL